MTPAALPGDSGSHNSAPTMMSDPRGSLTVALRKESKRLRRWSSCPATEPRGRLGPPLTITLVGSPAVWESTTCTRSKRVEPAGNHAVGELVCMDYRSIEPGLGQELYIVSHLRAMLQPEGFTIRSSTPLLR